MAIGPRFALTDYENPWACAWVAELGIRSTPTSNVPATFSGAWFLALGGELGDGRRFAQRARSSGADGRDGTKVAGGGAGSVGRSVGSRRGRLFENGMGGPWAAEVYGVGHVTPGGRGSGGLPTLRR